MNGPAGNASTGDGSTPLSDQVTRSLGAVWRRHSSGAPGAIDTEIDRDVVRCVLKEAVAGFHVGPPSDEPGDTERRSRASNVAAYRYSAIAAVERLTKRRVVGYVPRRDKATDTATETFILEPIRTRY